MLKPIPGRKPALPESSKLYDKFDPDLHELGQLPPSEMVRVAGFHERIARQLFAKAKELEEKQKRQFQHTDVVTRRLDRIRDRVRQASNGPAPSKAILKRIAKELDEPIEAVERIARTIRAEDKKRDQVERNFWVVKLVGRGLSNKEIAAHPKVQCHEKHIPRILRKLKSEQKFG